MALPPTLPELFRHTKSLRRVLLPRCSVGDDDSFSPLRDAMEVNGSITEVKVGWFSSKEMADPNTHPREFLIQCYLYRNRCGLHDLRTEDKHKVLPFAFARMLTVPDDEEHCVGLPHRQQVLFDFIRTIPNLFKEH